MVVGKKLDYDIGRSSRTAIASVINNNNNKFSECADRADHRLAGVTGYIMHAQSPSVDRMCDVRCKKGLDSNKLFGIPWIIPLTDILGV